MVQNGDTLALLAWSARMTLSALHATLTATAAKATLEVSSLGGVDRSKSREVARKPVAGDIFVSFLILFARCLFLEISGLLNCLGDDLGGGPNGKKQK